MSDKDTRGSQLPTPSPGPASDPRPGESIDKGQPEIREEGPVGRPETPFKPPPGPVDQIPAPPSKPAGSD